MATVRLRGALRALAGDAAEVAVDGVSVADALRALEREHPGLRGWIVDERGRVRRHINVFVNGEQANEAAAVTPGDRLEIIPAITGG